ncbi:hypothetical protein LBMAG09_05440 [Actinomycetes bacterium]|nr:hypothetical protein LBMAG09_05440 [Actinomycetes bacterium]
MVLINTNFLESEVKESSAKAPFETKSDEINKKEKWHILRLDIALLYLNLSIFIITFLSTAWNI